MGLAETAELAVRISLKDNASAGIRGLQKNISGLSGSLGRVGKGVGQVGAGFARAGLVVGGAIVTGLTAAAKAGADFEAQLNTINTIAHKSDSELTAVGDGLRTLAREGRGSLTDLSQGFYDILSAGITDTAAAQKVLTSATTLAIGGLSTNAQAVDLLTTAINAYGQSADKAQYDADLFAKAIELGKVTADEIAASFANVAPIAAQTGINIEEVAAAYASLTAQGTPAAEVTTQMSRAILDLLSPNKELLSLQKKTGKNFMQIAKDKGLVVGLQAMRDAVGNNDTAFKDLFGRVEGYKFALQTTGPQQEIYNDALKAMGDSAGTASGQMGERTQGLAWQIGRLKANLIDAGITLSSGFLPALSRTADKLSTFLGDAGNRSQLTALGQEIGDAIDKIDWARVLEGAKSFVGVMKGAVDFALTLLQAIDKLPDSIKAAGLGFLALNKLSGGLIGQGVGNIVGGLAGAGATGLASRAPGVGRLFAQPVFVTNWPLGGLGGGGGGTSVVGGGNLLGALGVASIVLALAVPVGEELRKWAKENLPKEFVPEGSQSQEAHQRARASGVTAEVMKRIQTGGLSPDERQVANDQKRKLDGIDTRLQSVRDRLRDVKAATDTARINTVAATRTGDASIVAAIKSSRPILNVRVNVSNSVRTTVYRTGTTINRTSTGVRGALLGA